MLNALRLRDGFDDEIFAARTGRTLVETPGYARALAEGLLQQSDGRCRATELGYRFLNDTITRFLPAH